MNVAVTPKRPIWKTVGLVVFWSIVVIAVLLGIAINWPLSDSAWWSILIVGGVIWFGHSYDRYKVEMQNRHYEITSKLREIDREITKMHQVNYDNYNKLRQIEELLLERRRHYQ